MLLLGAVRWLQLSFSRLLEIVMRPQAAQTKKHPCSSPIRHFPASLGLIMILSAGLLLYGVVGGLLHTAGG